MPTGSSVAVLTSSCNNLYTTLVKTTTCGTFVQLLLFLSPQFCAGGLFYFFPKCFFNISYAAEMRANSVAAFFLSSAVSGWYFFASARYLTPTSRHVADIPKSNTFNDDTTFVGNLLFAGILSNLDRPVIKSLIKRA